MNVPLPSADPWMSEACQSGLVSVIVPTYNRAHLIVSAVDSVFAQTYRPIELIVVDDGSTDDTAVVVESWASQRRGADFQIRLIRQANQGAQVARNRGLRECTGEYIQFLDSDDRILERKLSVQVDTLKKTGADYCYARTEGIDVNGRSQGLEGVPRRHGRPWLLERSWHTGSPLFLRRVCHGIGPWNESLRAWQDYEYSARIKAAGFRGAFLDEVLDQSWAHDGPSITNQDTDAYVPAVLTAVAAMLPLAPAMGGQARLERNRLSQHLVGLALKCARQKDVQGARLCLSSASTSSRGFVRIAITATWWACRLLPPRLVLQTGWSVAHLIWGIRKQLLHGATGTDPGYGAARQ